MNQGSLFLSGEGDAYFRRNESKLASDAGSPLHRPEISNLFFGLHSVLEIGCSNGINLMALKDRGFQVLVGVDPSSEAVRIGNEVCPALDLRVGLAEALPLGEGECFDMVLFGFCLYLVDRSKLLQAVSEADRALKPRGLMAIIDFDSPAAVANAYHHLDGVKSYKMDYANVFLSTNQYRLLRKVTLDSSPMPPPDGQRGIRIDSDKVDDAVALWILKKEDSY